MRVFPTALLGLLTPLGLAFSAFVLAVPGAHGQLVLQGAIGGSPAAKGKAGAPRRQPTASQPPREDALLGRDLARDGSAGRMTFRRVGETLELTHLSLTGNLISKPRDDCQVDVVAQGAIAVHPLGEPAGLRRYQIDLPACPFSFDILDAAVLVLPAQQSCDFVAADCRTAVGGLWGPSGASFSAVQAQSMARALVAVEKNMRGDFHILLEAAKKDSEAVKAVARDQASFSSDREMLCRDYSQEARHGFCALRVTEAKFFALQAKLGRTRPVAAHDRGAARAADHKGKTVGPAKLRPRPQSSTAPAAVSSAPPIQ